MNYIQIIKLNFTNKSNANSFIKKQFKIELKQILV